jgi:hypothetical protein
MKKFLMLNSILGMVYMSPAEDDGVPSGGAPAPSSQDLVATPEVVPEVASGIGKPFGQQELTPSEMADKARQEQEAQDAGGGKEKDLTEAETETVPPEEEEQEEAKEPKYLYKGKEVQVTNNPEVEAAFKEKGLDIDKVNVELFSEKGLTKETKESLYEAFGKPAVDMYLQGWESSNDAAMERMERAEQEYVREVDTIVAETVGDKKDAVLKWANDNLDAKTYEEYRKRINGDDTFAVRLALQDLANRSGLMNGTEKTTEPVESVRALALSPSSGAKGGEEQGLTQDEYQALFKPTGKGRAPYWDNPQKYDNLRELGRKSGR